MPIETETHTIPPGVQIASKFDAIGDTISQRISCGEYLQQLPTERELAAEFGVNVKTIRKALDRLVRTGLLYRRRGSGTFIQDADDVMIGQVALLVRSEGHVYGPMALQLCKSIQEKGGLPSVLDIEGAASPDNAPIIIRRALQANVRRVVAMCNEGFPYRVLSSFAPNLDRLVFLWREPEISFKADVVVPDIEAGAEMAARHLIELGHRRILLAGQKGMAQSLACDHGRKQPFYSGYANAMRGAGLEENSVVWAEAVTDPQWQKELTATVSRLRPTAVLATSDALAARIGVGLRAAGMHVPDDLALVGFYNTPWCDLTEVPLTSVSVREAELARVTMQRLASDDPPGEKVLVAPEVVVRKSCGSRMTT